jgi:hypothetical protein
VIIQGYFMKYYQSHKTLLWIWIMLCSVILWRIRREMNDLVFSFRLSGLPPKNIRCGMLWLTYGRLRWEWAKRNGAKALDVVKHDVLDFWYDPVYERHDFLYQQCVHHLHGQGPKNGYFYLNLGGQSRIWGLPLGLLFCFLFSFFEQFIFWICSPKLSIFFLLRDRTLRWQSRPCACGTQTLHIQTKEKNSW